MSQMIIKTSKYVTQDKKIPTMQALFISDGVISASAQDFILRELMPDASYLDLSGKTLIPGFIDCYGDFLKRAKALAEKEGLDLEAAIEKLCSVYVENGFTTAVQKTATLDDYNLLLSAGKNGRLSIDIAVYMNEKYSDILPENMPMDNPYVDHVRLAGVSMYVDDMIDSDSLKIFIIKHINKHQQIAFTANTKNAIDICLESYKAALSEVNGTKTDEYGIVKPKIYEDLRPLLCGCRDLDNSQLTLLQSLGFVPFFDHDMLFSSSAIECSYPVRDAVRRGLAFGITHDGIEFPSAIASMHLAGNRASEAGTAASNQTINCDQSLMAQTLFCAYGIFEDLTKGSLTMTKKADLVVLDNNPLEISDAAIHTIKVCMTIKNGEIVYKNDNI